MKPIRSLVIGVTIFLVFYALTPHFGWAYSLIFSLFVIGSFLCIYLVFAVMIYGEPTHRKFSDGYWYCDIDKQYTKNA